MAKHPRSSSPHRASSSSTGRPDAPTLTAVQDFARDGRREQAAEAMEIAYTLLVQATAALGDEGLRRSALHAPTSHAELVQGRVARARAAGLPAARYTAHLQGTANLRESIERLIDTGLRLNEQAGSAALHAFLIEEVTELLGARRALLVLETADGLAIAGAQVPEGETPEALLQAAQRRWVLFATAKSPGESGVVTVAYSSDLVSWAGAGYVDATRRLPGGIGGQPTSGQAENPFVVPHAGLHYLFFSDWRDPEDPATAPSPRTIVQYATSATLTADSTGSRHWVYRCYIPDPGVNAVEVQEITADTWVMSQSISNENSGDHEDHRRDLRMKCVAWGGSSDFGTANMIGIRNAGSGCAAAPLAAEPQAGLR